MKKIFSFIIFNVVALVAVAQGYRNPIIPGYHPDPSVCRVGDDFYLVNSSFQYFPAVPIYHSKDLVNWEQIGNVLDRESQIPLKGASSWTGIYAPTIRYNDGKYYMITTNVGGGGNFLVTAKDPKGPWSEPVWLEQQGIDPSLYFENGRCYMVSNPGDAIWMCEINPKTGKQLTKSRQLWQGTGGRYPEGPHIYKKDGYYYLLISEGGTEYGHQLSIARSRDIYGPYEGNPANPILCHQRRIAQSNQIQGTGHGDFVQAADGSWWVTFLGFRTFGGNYHHLGRETFLAPMTWAEGAWPIVNGNGTVDTLMNVRTLPQVAMPKTKNTIYFDRDNWTMSKFGPEWIYIQNPDMSKYEILDGKLRLHSSLGTLTDNNRPTFIGRRQQSAKFDVRTCVLLHNRAVGDEAGLTVYQINDGHFDVCVSRDKDRLTIKSKYRVKSLNGEDAENGIYIPTTMRVLPENTKVYLRIIGDDNMYTFCYSLDGVVYQLLGKMNTSLLSSEVVGGFTGAIVGMYCTSQKRETQQYADFSFFEYEEKE